MFHFSTKMPRRLVYLLQPLLQLLRLLTSHQSSLKNAQLTCGNFTNQSSEDPSSRNFHKALGFEPISRLPCSWLWMFAGLLSMKVSSISFKPVEFSAGPLKVRQLRWRSAEESWKLGIWEYHFIIPCSAKKHCVSVYGVQCYPYSVLIILFLYPCFRI